MKKYYWVTIVKNYKHPLIGFEHETIVIDELPLFYVRDENDYLKKTKGNTYSSIALIGYEEITEAQYNKFKDKNY